MVVSHWTGRLVVAESVGVSAGQAQKHFQEDQLSECGSGEHGFPYSGGVWELYRRCLLLWFEQSLFLVPVEFSSLLAPKLCVRIFRGNHDGDGGIAWPQFSGPRFLVDNGAGFFLGIDIAATYFERKAGFPGYGLGLFELESGQFGNASFQGVSSSLLADLVILDQAKGAEDTEGQNDDPDDHEDDYSFPKSSSFFLCSHGFLPLCSSSIVVALTAYFYGLLTPDIYFVAAVCPVEDVREWGRPIVNEVLDGG